MLFDRMGRRRTEPPATAPAHVDDADVSRIINVWAERMALEAWYDGTGRRCFTAADNFAMATAMLEPLRLSIKEPIPALFQAWSGSSWR